MCFSKKIEISEVIKERRVDYQNRRSALWELRGGLHYIMMNGLREPLDGRADEEEGGGLFERFSCMFGGLMTGC